MGPVPQAFDGVLAVGQRGVGVGRVVAHDDDAAGPDQLDLASEEGRSALAKAGTLAYGMGEYPEARDLLARAVRESAGSKHGSGLPGGVPTLVLDEDPGHPLMEHTSLKLADLSAQEAVRRLAADFREQLAPKVKTIDSAALRAAHWT